MYLALQIVSVVIALSQGCSAVSASSRSAFIVSTRSSLSSASTRNGNKRGLFAYMDDQLGRPNKIQVDKSKSGNVVSRQNLPPSTLPNGGKITMVGSGPGDPDLLTVAAYKLLSDPSLLVISDRLVSPEILELVKGEIKIARKLPGCAEAAQIEIYDWCKEGIDAGKHVVRLKIGDPFVFGRGGEEVIKFREFGVEPKVIPGVSAAFSAPLLGSIPVTHRGVANQVVMCTGYGRNGTSPDLIQYHKEQTIVFLMAVGRLRELCQRLIDMAGYPSKTPVGIIQDAGCPSQRTVVGTMETIGDLAEEYEVKAPSTIVVGEVVRVLLQDESDDANELQGLVQNMTSAEAF
jgi:uroporphyrin-III C-methyltransferase